MAKQTLEKLMESVHTLTEMVGRTEARNQELEDRIIHLENAVHHQAAYIADLQARTLVRPRQEQAHEAQEDFEEAQEEFEKAGDMDVEAAEHEEKKEGRGEDEGAGAGRFSVLFKEEGIDAAFDIVARSYRQPTPADIATTTATAAAKNYPGFPKSFRLIFDKWIISDTGGRPSVWALETSHHHWRRRLIGARKTTFSREKKVMRRFLDLVRHSTGPVAPRVRMARHSIEEEIHQAGSLVKFLSTLN
ncbi:hypothetical protein BG015_005389 [Linnemannia schmuckeri]|uniref:Uncharacterized protein n=1 Tax=Linnemannia schmuckeri TaxID=64567 RepID=A0A9P5SA49_9FUNG|nr:hypothetical protein BG015_005389 [Linnemannia schmuckeri]